MPHFYTFSRGTHDPGSSSAADETKPMPQTREHILLSQFSDTSDTFEFIPGALESAADGPRDKKIIIYSAASDDASPDNSMPELDLPSICDPVALIDDFFI